MAQGEVEEPVGASDEAETIVELPAAEGGEGFEFVEIEVGAAPQRDPEIHYRIPSRLFAGPNKHQPHEFPAYGFVAFTSRATPQMLERYRAICEGFLATIPSAGEVSASGISLHDQMVTVWPVMSETSANELNSRTGYERCEQAIEDIDLRRSEIVIKKVRDQTGKGLVRRGPYVIAWSPGESFHKDTTVVLVMDLSDVRDSEQATDVFRYWVREIQRDSDQWSGWNMERLRIKVELFAAKLGPVVLMILDALR